MSCQYYPPNSGWEVEGWYDAVTQSACYPVGGGGSINNPPNNNQSNSGGGTYSQTLAAILSGLALWQGAQYVPTPLGAGQTPYGAQPPQPTYINSGVGGNVTAVSEPKPNAFGAIQQYITDHPLPVLLGVVLVGAWLMKPPVRVATR